MQYGVIREMIFKYVHLFVNQKNIKIQIHITISLKSNRIRTSVFFIKLVPVFFYISCMTFML